MTGKSGLPHSLARRTKGKGVQPASGPREGSAAPGRGAAARRTGPRPVARGEAVVCRLARALCLRRACGSSGSRAVYKRAPAECWGLRSCSVGWAAWEQPSGTAACGAESQPRLGRGRWLERLVFPPSRRKGAVRVCETFSSRKIS